MTYENGANMTLRIVEDGNELTTLQSGTSATFRQRRNLLPDHMQAFDTAGKLRYDKVVTWEDLKANGWRLVIR